MFKCLMIDLVLIGVVDVCLIPEVPFKLDKLCKFVAKIVKAKGHCVVCIAEGCGQDVLGDSGQRDASGNPVLSDIGDLIKQEFNRYFEVTCKTQFLS